MVEKCEKSGWSLVRVVRLSMQPPGMTLTDRGVRKRHAGSGAGPAHLFFGCRSEAGDFLYADEWRQLVEEGVLAALHVAFSRDGPHKRYVTHLIREQAAIVWQLLQQANPCTIASCTASK